VISRRFMGGFRLGNRRWYPWLFLVLCGAILLVAYRLGVREIKIEWVVSVLGGAGGLTAFFYTQHLQETRLLEVVSVFKTRV
jgi:hypothetical protein